MHVARPSLAVEWAIRDGACDCVRLRVCLRRRLRRESAVLRPAAAARSGAPSGGDDPQRWTPLNKPVVRQSQAVSYGQFLQDVRSLSIKEVVVSHEGTDRALLLYKDGRVRYCQFPADDPRLADVLSTYGVVATAAVAEPSPPDTAQMRQFKDAAMYWVPAALIGVVYAVVTHMARTKGDFEVSAQRLWPTATTPAHLHRVWHTHAGAAVCLVAADPPVRACVQDRVKLRKLADAERQEAKERAIKEAMEDAAGGEALQPGALACMSCVSLACLNSRAPRSKCLAACPSRTPAGS